MYIRVHDGYGDGLLGQPAGFKNGGLPVNEGDAPHLLTILAGRSSYQTYLTKAMANRATTVPKRFLRIVTSVSHVPKHLQHVFTSGGGRMTGGTIDRWTRTIFMVELPGLPDHTRLEYALHECVHLFADPHAPTPQTCPQPCIGAFQHEFGHGFGEGLTQVITEDIMDKQGISLIRDDRPHKDFVAIMRAVIPHFGLDAMARAYFFGAVKPLRTAMEARWGANNVLALTQHTSAGFTKRVLDWIPVLEAAHNQRMKAEEARRKQLEEIIRTSPRGDFPIPIKARTLAGFSDPQPAPARTDWRRRMIPDPPPPPLLVFRRIGPFAVEGSVLTPQLKQQVKQVVDFVKSNLYPPNPIGVIRIVGHTDGTGPEAFNIGLGNRRMEAVRKELHAQLGDLVRLVLVDTEESPGKSKPIGDNRTEKGRSANRRVDVYVGPPIPKAEPWTKPYRWTWTPPPPPPPDWCLDCDLTPLGGKSVREFLMDLCGRRFKRDTCKKLVDTFISGGCSGIAAFLGQIGATISDEQKKVIEQHCSAAANKKIGVPQR